MVNTLFISYLDISEYTAEVIILIGPQTVFNIKKINKHCLSELSTSADVHIRSKYKMCIDEFTLITCICVTLRENIVG
jgi:hypothetical protein